MLPLLLVAGANVLLAPVPPDANETALANLRGTWRAVSVEEKGKRWGEREVRAIAFEFTGDTMIYRRGEWTERFRASVDVGAKPTRLDLRLIAREVDPKLLCPAIYELDGNRLRVCLASEFKAEDPADRPREFATGSVRPPQGRLLFVLEREKK